MKLISHLRRIPPHVGIIGVIIAVVAGASVALLLSRSEPKAEAVFVPRAARVERVDGNVGIARAPENTQNPEWTGAELNTPLAVGDRIYADRNSRAAIAFTGRNYARLDSGSALDVLSLADRRTQLALRSGSAIFDVGDLAPGELFEVATPGGAVDFYEPGLYQIGIGDGGNTIINVLSGLAQVVGLAGTGQISKGEVLTLIGQTAAQVLLSRIAPDFAGGLLNDYFGYRYPNIYDGRYSDYDYYLNDPYYYDPYRHSISYQYLPEDIAGAYDLDYYGDWVDVDGYGRCWSPHVATDWAPYRYGYWDVDDVYGPTWVSDEAWGWAPYHYGRWALVNGRWYWVPQQAISQPVYAPALVAFVPVAQTNEIAWVPLAPGDPYVPRYYDTNFNPHYISSPDVITQVASLQQTFVNMSVPQAITAVPVERFTSYIEPAVVTQVDPQLIAQSRAVLDPLAVESLREVVVRDENAPHKLKAKWIDQQVFNTPVVTSVEPVIPPARADIAQALQVQPVPEKHKKNRLNIQESNQPVAALQPGNVPPIPQPHASERAQERGQRIAELATQAAQGDRSAKREMKRLEREQRREAASGSQVFIPQQTPIEQSRQQRKMQKQLERQQRQATVNQQPAQNAPRAWSVEREQRKAQKRADRAMIQQQRASVIQQSSQQAQWHEMRKAQKQAERQQRQQQMIIQQQRQQQAVPQMDRQQRKLERQQRRQQQQVVVQQQPTVVAPQMDRQQRKLERQQRRQQEQAATTQVYRAPVYSTPPQKADQAPAYNATQPSYQPDRAQRKLEKQQRKAGRGNQ